MRSPVVLGTVVSMSHIELILIAVVVLFVFVLVKFGNKDRPPRPGQRRRPNSHYRSDGRPKRSYDTKKEAMVQARVLANTDGAAMDAYRCSECHKWHVGHEK
jgi:hypothetical protein